MGDDGKRPDNLRRTYIISANKTLFVCVDYCTAHVRLWTSANLGVTWLKVVSIINAFNETRKKNENEIKTITILSDMTYKKMSLINAHFFCRLCCLRIYYWYYELFWWTVKIFKTRGKCDYGLLSIFKALGDLSKMHGTWAYFAKYI